MHVTRICYSFSSIIYNVQMKTLWLLLLHGNICVVVHYWVNILTDILILSTVVASSILISRIVVVKFSWVLIVNRIRTVYSPLRVFNAFRRVNSYDVTCIRWWSNSEFMFSIWFRNWDNSLFFICLGWSLLTIYNVLIAVWHRIVD